MLHDIIMSCPLKTLELNECSGLKNILIPCCSRLESLLVVETVPIGGTILVNTSSFQRFSYSGYGVCWPVSLMPASKKNLKELRIDNVYIESDSFGKLVSELPSIQNVKLSDCTMEKCITIASQTLKELRMRYCDDLYRVIMEAPELNTFCYHGNCLLTSVINSHNNYNAYFHLTVSNLDTRAFLIIKHLLIKSNGCKVLSVILSDETEVPEIKFDKGQVRNFGHRPPSEPKDIQELKLSLSFPHSVPEESSCRALIDGLLWCCRPEILSVSVTLRSDNPVIKMTVQLVSNKKRDDNLARRRSVDGGQMKMVLVCSGMSDANDE
ncbi:hypothetical protein KSS87_000206 [Heliosperma pusillum]|nr:hypothetical protein KSS87_000206 [Heliosperma pusillum]